MVLHASVFKVSGNRSYELRHPALMPQKYSSKYRHIDVSHFSNETSSLYVGIIFHSFKKLNQATLYFPSCRCPRPTWQDQGGYHPVGQRLLDLVQTSKRWWRSCHWIHRGEARERPTGSRME